MRPVIGITPSAFGGDEWNRPFVGQRQSYLDAVVAAGGAPLLFPNVADEEIVRALYERVDGILLSGGGDVDPAYYGEEPIPELGSVDAPRDSLELALSRWAVAEGKPIFGICRGIQVLNVALGGSLYQDIPSQMPDALPHTSTHLRPSWYQLAHDLRLARGSRLAEIFGTTTFPVNSSHHQAIKVLAPGLRAVGWAPDGVVEAVEGSDGQFVVGVQCHPEALLSEIDPRWHALFKHFVDSCSRD